MSNLQLANNLQYLRLERKLTQDELSKQLNISRQAYSNYETSKRTPDLDSLLRLAEFYNVTLDALVLHNLRTWNPSAQIAEGSVPYTLSVSKVTGKKMYITEEEINLLTKYRSLTAKSQQVVTGFINESYRKQ